MTSYPQSKREDRKMDGRQVYARPACLRTPFSPVFCLKLYRTADNCNGAATKKKKKRQVQHLFQRAPQHWPLPRGNRRTVPQQPRPRHLPPALARSESERKTTRNGVLSESASRLPPWISFGGGAPGTGAGRRARALRRRRGRVLPPQLVSQLALKPFVPPDVA